jgi:hypothetical protein
MIGSKIQVLTAEQLTKKQIDVLVGLGKPLLVSKYNDVHPPGKVRGTLGEANSFPLQFILQIDKRTGILHLGPGKLIKLRDFLGGKLQGSGRQVVIEADLDCSDRHEKR